MPSGAAEGIREGMYRFRPAPQPARHRAHLLASGPLINEALRAQSLLLEYGVAADVWSVTSYKTLRMRTLEADRWNMLHPDEPPRVSYLQKAVQEFDGPSVAVSDYVRLVSEQIAPWIPGGLLALGDGRFWAERHAEDVTPVLRTRCRTPDGGDTVCSPPARDRRGADGQAGDSGSRDSGR